MSAASGPCALRFESTRLESGVELLTATVTAAGGRVGVGVSYTLDATEARHLAEWRAGVRDLPGRYSRR